MCIRDSTMAMYCKIADDLIQQAKSARRDLRAAKWKAYYKFKESCLILCLLYTSRCV